ncbi:sugar ABC transporter substrate-binding protein [Streptomyces sp. NPDC005356]|uniref:ABC transporter substrate-binding protein n=1 Tax=Streptomyces sp. NPDC005356 TaxID=3157167 RepID=UPI0033B2B44C
MKPTSRTSRIALLAAVASLALAATACGGSDGGNDVKSGGKPVTITYWSATAGAKETAAAFNKSHQDVKVKFAEVPAGPDGVTKLSNAIKGGNAPDVATMDYSELPEFASQGNLTDLSKVAGDTVKHKFPEGVQSLVNLGGKTWAVPFDITPLELYYRADLFKKYGVDVPNTWADYQKAAETIKKKNPAVRITNFGGNDPAIMAGLAWQAGAKWYATSGNAWKVNMQDSASTKVADFWTNLVTKDLVSKTPLWAPEETKERASGKVVSFIGAAWSAGGMSTTYGDTKGKWAIAPLPTWDGKPATGMYGGTSYIVPKGGKAEAASEFIDWVTTSKAGLKARFTSLKAPSSALPANAEMRAVAAQSYDKSFFPAGVDPYRIASAAADTIVPGWTWSPVQQQVNAAMNKSAADFAKGQAEGQKAAETAVNERGLSLAK